jgi:hypothetical protein
VADWLNVTLAGPYSLTLLRDGVSVDPASVGATLTVTAGVITLTTPGDESHEWMVQVQPDLPPSKYRMSAWDFTAIESAEASNGAETISLSTTNPIAPDPATFTGYGTLPSLTLTEPA